MKRRGFLGALFGAPVAVVAGKAAAEFPKELLPEEPVLDSQSGYDGETFVSAFTQPLDIEEANRYFRQFKRSRDY
jgi:hypothetical protein